MEHAVDVIERTRCGLVLDGGASRLAADDALQTQLTHEPFHGATRNVDALPHQLAPDLAHAIDLEVLGKDACNLRPQHLVPLSPTRPPSGIAALGAVYVVRRRGDRQDLADRLDPIDVAMIVNEGIIV